MSYVILNKNEKGTYGSGKNQIDTTKEKYDQCDLFFFINHKPKESSGGTFLNFKKSEGSINEHYYFYDKDNLKYIEIYFSIYNNSVPLVLVVTTKGTRFYGFTYLKSIKVWTPISNTNKFNANQLLDNLIKENNKLNNVITYRIDKTNSADGSYDGVTVKKEKHPSFEKYKHTPENDCSGYIASYLLFNGKLLQLTNDSGYTGDDKLDHFTGKKFCEIFVFYTLLSKTLISTNLPKYLEVKEERNNTSRYFERDGHTGIRWNQIKNPELDNLITYFLDKKTTIISEKYNDESIEVTKSNNSSFDIYTHKPELNYQNKKANLRFDDLSLTLEPNDLLPVDKKLKGFDGKTYLSVSLFYYKGGNTQLPGFLELSVKNGTTEDQGQQVCTITLTCYLFQRVDDFGTRWKQIGYQDLRKTVTYQLEWKSSTGKYNDTVEVSKTNQDSFEIYSHIPKEIHKDKSGLLLFNFSMLTLQPNDDSKLTNKLDKLHGKNYCQVNVYYYSSFIPPQPPLFLELLENKGDDSCESNHVEETNCTSKCYWLERLDTGGLHWKQIRKPEKLDKNKSLQIAGNVLSNDKDSIMVYITEVTYYGMKTIKHYDKIGTGTPTNPVKEISAKLNGISDYRYYEHDFSSSKDIEKSGIVRLRVFMGNLEIKFLNTGRTNQDFNYNPSKDTEKKVYVYFKTGDNIPLLLHYDGKWYRPNTKENYLDEWNLENGINSTKPGNSSDNTRVTQELDKINKRLNEIDLSKTKGDGYGIKKPGQSDGKEYYKSPDNKFDGKRIDVKKENPLKKFSRIIHSTKNSSYIGKVMLGSNELKDDQLKTLSAGFSQDNTLKSATISSVTAFYHLSDQSCEKPLLLRFKAGTTGRNDPFYQRLEFDNNLNWKKIETKGVLLTDDGQADKINQIHYEFTHSVKIQLENQGNTSSNTYQVKLVKNTPGGDSTVPQSTKNITVSEDSTDCSLESNYKCIKHAIPKLTTEPSRSDVGGLRFYIGDKEINISNSLTNLGKLFIYFIYTNFQVHVYFHTDGGHIDKVPLLFRYDGKCYGPKSKDEYFNQWVLETGLSSSSESQQITTRLHQINKSLNEVNITQNNHGSSYGLTKPRQSNGIDDSFGERISVQQANNKYYNKLVHSTINKGPIGRVMYNNITIATDSASQNNNQVSVYYHTSDTGYNRPLLICIGSQNHVNTCVKWYYRQNVEGTQWKNDEEIVKYIGDEEIQKQLESIQSRDSNFILLSIDKQGSSYQITTKTGAETEEESKTYIGTMGIDSLRACSSYEVGGNYKCFKHQLCNYYQENKEEIKRKLKLDSGDPTLEAKILIAGHELKIMGEDGQQPLSSPLTYGKDDASRGDTYDPYVYFYEKNGYGNDNVDKVPLLFKFGNQFFGPFSKDSFFEKWKEFKIETTGGDKQIKDNLRSVLNRITRLLNVINLQTTDGEYGEIKPGDGPDPLEAKKRVSVTKQNNSDYHTVTHSTANTGCVGYVYYSGSELKVFEGDGADTGKNWSDAIEEEIGSKTDIYDDLTAYYHKTDKQFTNPLLIKITGVGGTTPLFYERTEKDNNLKWKRVTKSLRDDGITEKINQIFYNFNKSVKIQIEKYLPIGRSTTYLLKLVINSSGLDDSGLLATGNITIDNDKNCRLGVSYTCIKHSIGLTMTKISEVGGLRFYFGNKEVETYNDDRASVKASIYYYSSIKNVHVYFHSTNSTMPLMFRYKEQCFKPNSKENYFNKWVHDSGINGKSHPKVTDLIKIDTMLNEINLEKTGTDGGKQEYGLDKPVDVGNTSMKDFNENRITATRDQGNSKGYKSVTHSTNNNLGIGNVKYGDTDVTTYQRGQKNLSYVVKQEQGLLATRVNEVTVYYHITDNDYKTPLLLRFGNKGTVGSETGAATPTVFYESFDSNKLPTTWKRVSNLETAELTSPDNEQKIADKLNEIRYGIGKSVIINIEKQNTGDEKVEYPVQVVENNPGSSRSTGPQPISNFEQKITVTKNENCTETQTAESGSQSTSKYTCFNHKIPGLTGVKDHPLIGGVKFYVCDKTYLPTFEKGGYPPEPIYYNNKQLTVTVYFYSSGHGPPETDTVPLLVKYGTKYYAPKNRFSYFSSWDRVDVQVSTEDQGSENQGPKLKDLLDGINKDLNTVDISITGSDTSVTGYGLSKTGPNCPCSSPNNFCDRLSSKREKVTKPSSQAGGAEARATLDTSTTTLFNKVIHTTKNRGPVGQVYLEGQLISVIKTTEVDGCNEVTVYYDAKDTQYQTPLLICLGEQTDGQAQPPQDTATATTPCKKWYKRTGIEITQWEEVKDQIEDKFKEDSKIKDQLDQILDVFKDYLYLEIEKLGKPYDAYVSRKTGGKQKVDKVGDGSDEKNKIKVTDASGDGAEVRDQVQVPDDYKAYKHGLKEFYNGAKTEINKALKKSLATNQVTDSGDDPTLHLRLQVANQVISLFNEGGSTPAGPLEYKLTDTESDTDGKKDPIVFFYKGSGTEDTVPLLFKFGTTYFGPKDRHSYFQGWQEYKIDGTDGAQTKDDIKKKLDDINRQLNEIDLTKTGGGDSRTSFDYGLEKGGSTLTGSFSTKRIEVRQSQIPVSSTINFTYVSHTTVNKYNIGNILKLGQCSFDNKHTEHLKTENHKHNEAVAVYTGVGITSLGTQNPQLVLITESKSRDGGSTVHGYYDLTSKAEGGCPSDGKYTFEKVNTGFDLNDITDREKMKSEDQLLSILIRIGIIKAEVQSQVRESESSYGSGFQDNEISQEDDPEEEDSLKGDGDGGGSSPDMVPDGMSVQSERADGRRGSAGMGAGAVVEQRPAGSEGPSGKQGSMGPPSPPETETAASPTSPSNGHTPTTGHVTEVQPQTNHGGGVYGGKNGGGAMPHGGGGGGSGSSSSIVSESIPSPQTGSGEENSVMEIIKKPEVYASASGTVGVGVMATVGAVVYKKCIATPAIVAGTKAAAKVAASAASGI